MDLLDIIYSLPNNLYYILEPIFILIHNLYPYYLYPYYLYPYSYFWVIVSIFLVLAVIYRSFYSKYIKIVKELENLNQEIYRIKR